MHLNKRKFEGNISSEYYHLNKVNKMMYKQQRFVNFSHESKVT